MRSNAVQFRGLKQVLKAYQTNDIPAWSMWNGNDLLFKYPGDDIEEGAELISQAVDLLKEGESEGAYTLKVHSKVPGGDIDSKTPYSGSFKFGLFDPKGEGSPYHMRQNSILGVINDRFDKLQEAYMTRVMDKMEAEDEEEEEPKKEGGIVGMINGLLENPQIKQALMMKIGSWLSGFLGGAPAPAQVAGVESPKAAGTAANPVLTDDQEEKINMALDILIPLDPSIGDHLLKIAAIARDSPTKYKMYTSML